MNMLCLNKPFLIFCAGLLAVLGFAPFSLFPLTILTLAVLFWQWQHTNDKRAAAWLGFAFGAGLFGAGISWIYVALHDYGDMRMLLALLATVLFAAVLALFPALAGYAQARIKAPVWARLVLVMPALWVLLEWLRGLLFTGFPWLAFGYSQAAASPLAGYAPLFGVYGVSLAVAVSAGLLALGWQARWSKQGKLALVALLLLWGGGAALRAVEWTQTEGEPFKVALLQGNIAQDLKFREDKLIGTLAADSQSYRKNHLVPFGEFIPLRPVLGWLVNEVLNIPMSDLARGGERQAVLRIAGQRVAVQICYEDVFGEEVIRYLPEATLLVNVSNDAWYGRSHAAMQHNQIAQMRALETGRMMLRATNTGVTSIIGRDGVVQQMLPQHEQGILTGQVQGYTGSTPYVRWGNAAMLGLLVLMLASAWRLRRK